MTRRPRKKQQHLVSRTLMDGQTVWSKPVRPKRRTHWHRVMDVVARVFCFPLIARTVHGGGAEGLRLEAERLKQATEKGVHVPQILVLESDRLVTTDIGASVEFCIRTNTEREARLALLSHAARALAAAHAKGFVHGRPYLRDMTWDGKEIGFIDLEEDPLSVMPFAAAQARDVWLFINASANAVLQETQETAVSFLFDVFKVYVGEAPSGYEPELRRLVKVVRVLRRALGSVLMRDGAPRDMRRAALANAALERYFFNALPG